MKDGPTMRWEYKILIGTWDELTQHGQDGWELMHVSAGQGWVSYMLKRPIEASGRTVSPRRKPAGGKP